MNDPFNHTKLNLHYNINKGDTNIEFSIDFFFFFFFHIERLANLHLPESLVKRLDR